MSMVLRGENGHEFELAIIAEPNMVERSDIDSGLPPMTLTFRAANQEEEWEETAPILGTSSVEALASWLEDVAETVPDLDELELIEPELRFAVLRTRGENVVLRISFHLKDLPEEAAVTPETTEASRLDLDLPRGTIRAAVAALRADLAEAQAEVDADPVGLEGVQPPIMTRAKEPSAPQAEEADEEATGEDSGPFQS